MDESAAEFRLRAGAVLQRFAAQNGAPAFSDAEIAGFTGRLWALVRERGLPRPLAAHERGTPGEMTDAECAPLVERVAGTAPGALSGEAARQLVKACFYPEFKTCRDSFRECSPDGTCRRQELARVRRRVSGAHCVDCPYWVTLTPDQHEEFLAREWQAPSTGSRLRQGYGGQAGQGPAAGSGQAASASSRERGAAAFLAHRDIFLPEDFRALRRWLYSRARQPGLG